MTLAFSDTYTFYTSQKLKNFLRVSKGNLRQTWLLLLLAMQERGLSEINSKYQSREEYGWLNQRMRMQLIIDHATKFSSKDGSQQKIPENMVITLKKYIVDFDVLLLTWESQWEQISYTYPHIEKFQLYEPDWIATPTLPIIHLGLSQGYLEMVFRLPGRLILQRTVSFPYTTIEAPNPGGEKHLLLAYYECRKQMHEMIVEKFQALRDDPFDDE